eukprot:TRINITY_DN4582_c0_g1_i1.p1 TRINITY_DN4582_c0_g1~~TRINITY_DN4582_c0_g1_i1.p1  ORF type:complete len:224 (+),score=51.63 TRINITY_DN4582_c0_g1_i1:71-742(+)
MSTVISSEQYFQRSKQQSTINRVPVYTAELENSTYAQFNSLIMLWLQKYDPAYFYSTSRQSITRMISETVNILIGVLNYFSCTKKLLVALMKYCNVYVSKHGLRQSELLHLLIISGIVSLKMWNEEKMNINKIIADLFGFRLSDINNMERIFFGVLEYNLYLADSDLAQYCEEVSATIQASTSSDTLSSIMTKSSSNSTQQQRRRPSIVEEASYSNRSSAIQA